MVGGQNPGPEAPPRSKKGREKKGQRKGQERSDCQGAMEMGGCVRVIEWEEVRRDEPIEYILPTGVGSNF